MGWGCNHVSGSCTHAGCYATATLVCELSVFCVNMVRCWCVHVYTWYVAGVSCAGWGGVGVGMHSRFWKLHCYAAATLVCELSVFDVNMVRCWCVHVYTWYVAGFWKLHTCWMLRHGNVGV